MRRSELQTLAATSRPAPHLQLLDGMRGLAATMVVLHHLGGLLNLPWLAPRGYLAVDYFFMLSGFVLTNAYEERLLTGRLTIKAFLIARVIRLYPMIIIGMCAGACIGLFTFRNDLPETGDQIKAILLGCLGFPIVFKSSLPPELFPLDGPLWSIFFEIIASLVFVVLMKTERRMVLAAAIMLAGLIALVWLARSEHEISVGSRLRDWHWGFARLGYAFFAGILLCRFKTIIPRIPALIAGCLCSLTFLVLRFESHNVLIDLLFLVAIFPVSIVALAWPRPHDWLTSCCKMSGDVSYPLYAIHYPVVLALGSLHMERYASDGIRFLVSIVTTALLIAASSLVFRFCDRPLRSMLTSMSSGRRIEV